MLTHCLKNCKKQGYPQKTFIPRSQQPCQSLRPPFPADPGPASSSLQVWALSPAQSPDHGQGPTFRHLPTRISVTTAIIVRLHGLRYKAEIAKDRRQLDGTPAACSVECQQQLECAGEGCVCEVKRSKHDGALPEQQASLLSDSTTMKRARFFIRSTSSRRYSRGLCRHGISSPRHVRELCNPSCRTASQIQCHL